MNEAAAIDAKWRASIFIFLGIMLVNIIVQYTMLFSIRTGLATARIDR